MKTDIKFWKKIIYSAALWGALIGQTCNLISLPLKATSLGHVGTYLIAGTNVLAMMLFLLMNEKRPEQNRNRLVLVILAFICLLAVIAGGTFRYGYLVKVLTFLQLPVYLCLLDDLTEIPFQKPIYYTFMAYPLWFFGLSLSPLAHNFTDQWGKNVQLDVMTLGYGNPNETSIYLFMTSIVLLSAFFYFNGVRKILCGMEMLLLGYLMIRADSRAGILLYFCLLGVSLIPTPKIRLPKPVWMGILCIPLLTAVAFILFPELTELELMGASLDNGRAGLMDRAFSGIDAIQVLIGDFQNVQFNNITNAYLAVFTTVGIFGMLVFLYLFYRCMFDFCKQTLEPQWGKVALIGIFGLVLHSAVETAVFIAGSAYSALFLCVLYLFALGVKSK